ncbi:MAG: hypothetical protein K6G56_06125, partial [Clostridiales bacterium]|nr:hypothetical protein [Clostridiales bacterium]
MNGFVKKLLRSLFPDDAVCASCGREAVLDEGGLCEECRQGIELFVAAPPPDNTDGYTAPFVYNDVSSRMVKRLKYNGAKYEAKILARFIDIPSVWKIDAVVPVPLHCKRIKKRGFNQSEL